MRLNVDLLSAMPRQITETWSERLMVPFIMNFLPLMGVDLGRMSRGKSSYAIANGQYLLIRATAYQALEGHEAIKSAIVDDFAIAQRFMQHNQRVTLINGTTMLACRMYRSTDEVWHGFSKNIMLSLQTTRRWQIWSTVLFAWGFVSLFVLPYIIFIVYPAKHLALIEIGWLTLLRLAIGASTQRPAVEAVFTPFSAIGVMALGLNALFLKFRRRPIMWKDRQYHPDKPDFTQTPSHAPLDAVRE